MSKSQNRRNQASASLLEGLENRLLLANGDFSLINSFGSSGADQGLHVAVDKFGSIVVVGKFGGTVDFDPGTDTINLTSRGAEDIFVAKYSSTGTLVWAVSAGSTLADEAGAVVIDPAGNIYVGGSFQRTVDFRPGRRTFNLEADDQQDAFIWKLNGDGQFGWARRAGGAGHDAINGLALDSAGNIHAAGFFQESAKFSKRVTLGSTGSGRNAFVMKVTPASAVSWARNFAATGTTPAPSVDARGVAVDPDGNVYVAGIFNNTADFAAGPATRNLISAGGDDAFVTKLNSDGNFLWTGGMGGSGAEDLTGITLDLSGTNSTSRFVLTTGSYNGTADFDPDTANTVNLTSAGGSDIFVSRLDLDGDHDLSKSMGGAGADSGLAILTDRLGNIFTTGNFNTSADFDPDAGTQTLSSGSNLNHAFVSKLNPDGTFSYARGFFASTGGQATASGIGFGINGTLWTVGSFAGTVDFDPGTATQNKISSSSTVDVYVSRLVR